MHACSSRQKSCIFSSLWMGLDLLLCQRVGEFRLPAVRYQVLRTSDGGNGNHSVSLPIILIKIKVDKMLPSSYISSLLVSIL